MIRALTPLPAAPRAGSGRCRRARAAFPREAARLPLSPSWLFFGLFLVFWLGPLAVVRAQLAVLSPPDQPVGPSGLDGGRHVGSALLPARSVRLSTSLGYAYTGHVLEDGDRHHRLAGELFGAWLLHPALQLSLGSELRGDRHHTDSAGSDRGPWAGHDL